MISSHEIGNFLDLWLIHYRQVKYDKQTMDFVQKLMLSFSYEGTMVRGLYPPFQLPVKAHDYRINSYSKSMKGISFLQQYGEYVFGTFSGLQEKTFPFSSDEFQTYNSQSTPIPSFDHIVHTKKVGLDIVALAEYIDYREDFLRILRDVEEVLVIEQNEYL